MSVWAVIYLMLLAAECVLFILKHGEAREPYNLGHWLIGAGFMFFLLWGGGFFKAG